MRALIRLIASLFRSPEPEPFIVRGPAPYTLVDAGDCWRATSMERAS